MKRLLAAAAALVVLFGLAMGQGQPWSYSFNGGTGTCEFRARAFGEIWSASIKLFMTQNMKGFTWNGPPVTPDSPSKTMSGGWIMGKGVLKSACSLNLLFEEGPEAVKIYATASSKNMTKRASEKAARSFFDKLAASLYGIEEPAK